MKWLLKNALLTPIVALSLSAMDAKEKALYSTFNATHADQIQPPSYSVRVDWRDLNASQQTHPGMTLTWGERDDFWPNAITNRSRTYDIVLPAAVIEQNMRVQHRFEQGIAESPELIKAHYDTCQAFSEKGADLLQQAKTAGHHDDLEKIMVSANRGLKMLENYRETFDSRHVSPEGYERVYKNMQSVENLAFDRLHETLKIAKQQWEAKVDHKIDDWAKKYDKALVRRESYDDKIHECFEKTIVEQDRFKQAVYEGQLEYVQKQNLQKYQQKVKHFSSDKLQQEYAASCDRLATHLKNAEKYKAAIPRAHPGCTFPKVHLKKEEFYADLERGKQNMLLGLIAKKASDAKAVEQAGSAGPSAAAKSAESATDGFSDKAKSYAQTGHISDETAYRLGRSCIEDLAGIAQEVSDYPALLELGADLERSGVNPVDMIMTGQAGMGEQGVYDPGLRDAALNAGGIAARGVGKGISQFSTASKDAMFFAFDFLNNPKDVGSRFLADVAQGANTFTRQFKGDYVQLNNLLAKEPEHVRNFFQQQVGFYQGTYGRVLSPKTIETIVGAQYCASKLPSAVCNHFMGLLAEDKIAFVVSGGLGTLLPGAAMAHAGDTVAAVKLGSAVVGNAVKESLTTAAGGAAASAGRAGEALMTAVQGAASGERVAVTGVGELNLTPEMRDAAQKIVASKPKTNMVTSGEAGAQSGLPNSVFRQGEASGSGVVGEAIRQGESISLAGYDASLAGDLKKLEEAANMFKSNPSAVAKDGPLAKLLENGRTGRDVGRLGTARGAAYELEKAHDLAKTGEEVLGFGRKIGGREFDIETATKLIECKNIDWPTKVGEVANNMKGIFCDQAKKAQSIGKAFEVHSKNGVTSDWIKWFESKGIKVVEG